MKPVIPTYRVLVQTTGRFGSTGWIPSLITSMPTQSFLTLLGFGFVSPHFRLFQDLFPFVSNAALCHSWDQFQGCALEGNYSHIFVLLHYNNVLAVMQNMLMQISSITCRILMTANHSLQASKWYVLAVSIV